MTPFSLAPTQFGFDGRSQFRPMKWPIQTKPTIIVKMKNFKGPLNHPISTPNKISAIGSK
jgi:hypothetical protein